MISIDPAENGYEDGRGAGKQVGGKWEPSYASPLDKWRLTFIQAPRMLVGNGTNWSAGGGRTCSPAPPIGTGERGWRGFARTTGSRIAMRVGMSRIESGGAAMARVRRSSRSP